jgi:ABC-type Fe3+ transport system permease subunit
VGGGAHQYAGKRFIAAASMLPLFVPPLVAAVAWSILASPRTGLLNVFLGAMGIEWRFNVYSMGGLICIFGIYYAPYVYMFTASALRNMDPSLEEAAEVTGATALRTMFTVTFPLIAPAIISACCCRSSSCWASTAFRRCSARPPTSRCSPPISSSSPTGRRRSTARPHPSPSS